MATLSTGCRGLDKLMNGGFPLGAPSLLYGIPNLGKTWLSFQTACMSTRKPSAGGLNRPALYLDTESFFTADVFDRFYGFFRKRWKDLPKEAEIDMIRIKDIFELGEKLGIQYTIIQEEKRVSAIAKFPTSRQTQIAKGKGQVVKGTQQSSDWLINSEIWQSMKKRNYGLLIIDSLTVPIKSVIPKGTQHLPGRGTLLTSFLGTLYPIAIKFNAAIIVTDHISRNPMSPGYRYGLGIPWGGQDITYYIKYQFGMYHALKAEREKYGADGSRLRRLERHRFPGMEKELTTVLLAHDYGYTDLPTGARPA